jgi:hypothetical protein
MLEYIYAFRHVPWWWWSIGLLLIPANFLILYPKFWNGLAEKIRKDRLDRLYTRSFREYAGSTNGWVKS